MEIIASENHLRSWTNTEKYSCPTCMGNASYFSFWASQNCSAFPSFPFPSSCSNHLFCWRGSDSALWSLCPSKSIRCMLVFDLWQAFLFSILCSSAGGLLLSIYFLYDDATSDFNSSSSPQRSFVSECRCWMINSCGFLLMSFLPLEYLVSGLQNSDLIVCHLSSSFSEPTFLLTANLIWITEFV